MDNGTERAILRELAEQFPIDKWYLLDVADNGTIETVRRTTAEAEAKLGARK